MHVEKTYVYIVSLLYVKCQKFQCLNYCDTFTLIGWVYNLRHWHSPISGGFVLIIAGSNSLLLVVVMVDCVVLTGAAFATGSVSGFLKRKQSVKSSVNYYHLITRECESEWFTFIRIVYAGMHTMDNRIRVGVSLPECVS